jgi:hypothetical protein
MVTEIQSLNTLVVPYINVLKKFKNRGDVQSGAALAYREGQDYASNNFKIENKPKGIGDGLTNTGWCVSASQALLFDPIFSILIKDRKAFAKLISIDIQKRFYGKCYSGTQNKWHTAVLVKDSGQYFVIDLTCKQFGNFYVDKEIWDFDTWQKTFRSPIDNHILTDFENNELSCAPIPLNGLQGENIPRIMDELQVITSLTDDDRELLARFFTKNIELMNIKLLCGTISDIDYKYLRTINGLLEQLEYSVVNEDQYIVMKFDTKIKAKNWLDLFIKNNYITPQYLVLSNTIKNSCDFYGIDFNNIRKVVDSGDDTTYLVLIFHKAKGAKIFPFLDNVNLIIPFGIKTICDSENTLNPPLYNAGDKMEKDFVGNSKQTNTLVLELSL